MPGKKSSLTYKVMNPTTRKSAAEVSLLRKVKFEVDIKTLQGDLIHTEEERRVLEQEEKELSRRNEEQAEIKEQNDRIRKEIIKHTKVSKFTLTRNKEKITAKMKDLRESSLMLHEMNNNISQREKETSKGLNRLRTGFMKVLSKNERAKDLLKLTHSNNNKKQKDRKVMEDRKDELTNEIKTLQNNFEKMVKLDLERQSTPETRTKTLEDFMDDKVEALKSEIHKLNGQIKTVNGELTEITHMVDQRRQEVTDLKQAIKNTPKTSIDKSREYQRVLERNKKLQTQLDDFLNRQDELTEETRKIMNLIEEENRMKEQASVQEMEINKILHDLRKELETKTTRHEIDEKIIEDLRKQVESRDKHLNIMCSDSAKLTEKCQDEYDKLHALKKEVSAVGNENKAMLKLISRLSQETLQKMWYTV